MTSIWRFALSSFINCRKYSLIFLQPLLWAFAIIRAFSSLVTLNNITTSFTFSGGLGYEIWVYSDLAKTEICLTEDVDY